MWRLFRQWRFVRWVNKELLRHEQEQNMTTYGAAVLLSVQWAITEYHARFSVRSSEVKIRLLLELCIDEGYLSTQPHDEIGLSVKVVPSKGGQFVPVFSGLFLSELSLLGPLWAFLTGGGLVLLVWGFHALGLY
jgi:hypothetical protein